MLRSRWQKFNTRYDYRPGYIAENIAVGATLVGSVAVGIGVAVGVTGAIAYPEIPHHLFGQPNRVEKTVAAIAKRVIDREVIVQCTDLPTNVLARTTPIEFTDMSAIRLDTFECELLEEILTKPETVDMRRFSLMEAVKTIGHELGHIAGTDGTYVHDERVAECIGIQRTPQIAKELGLSDHEAMNAGNAAAEYQLIPDSYVPTSACAPGGALDMHLPGGVFPVHTVA